MDQKLTNKIQLFVTDIDSTLIAKNETLSAMTIDFLEKLESLGVKFCYNTARSYLRAKDSFSQISTTAPNALSMGSEYRDNQGNLFHIEYLSSDAKDGITQLISNGSYDSVVYYANAQLQPKIFSLNLQMLTYLGNRYYAQPDQRFNGVNKFMQSLKSQNLSSILFRTGETKQGEFVKDIATIQNLAEVHNIEKGTYIVTPKHVNKGYAIQIICDLLGIRTPEISVLSAGDDITDEPMFSKSIGIHVGNAKNTQAKFRVADTGALIDLLGQLIVQNDLLDLV